MAATTADRPGGRKSAHGEAADALMADGNWHTLDELVDAAGAAIPDDMAKRRAIAKNNTGRTGVDPDNAGRRAIMTRTAGGRVRRGTWETRMAAGKPREWRIVR